MGQLIKLYNYISRYETDIYRYPSQFIRLKHKQWDLYLHNWETGYKIDEKKELDYDSMNIITVEKESVFEKIKQIFKRNEDFKEEVTPTSNKIELSEHEVDDDIIQFQTSLENRPLTEEELKQEFLNALFNIQIRWASTTISQRSYVDSSFYREENLKYFIQRFPDTFLFLYKPIFKLKKAPLESETICITPTEVLCISFLEEEKDAVYLGADERFWEKRISQQFSKVLNPFISLNRTEAVIRQLFSMNDIDLPITKVLISRNGYIDYPSPPFGYKIIDQKQYDEWFEQMRNLISPIKHYQLKAAKVLLEYCQIISTERSYSI